MAAIFRIQGHLQFCPQPFERRKRSLIGQILFPDSALYDVKSFQVLSYAGQQQRGFHPKTRADCQRRQLFLSMSMAQILN